MKIWYIKYSAVSQHKNKPALGTRVIISEEDEMQPDGKIFKKVTFSLKSMQQMILTTVCSHQFLLGVFFQWRTYTQMNDEAENFWAWVEGAGFETI
jgi:long-chain acyl-CoA synthetase